MSIYNPLLKLTRAMSDASAGAAKTVKAGTTKIGDTLTSTASKVSQSKLGRYAAYPVAIGASAGVGAYALGTGVKEGFGITPDNPADAVKKASSWAIILIVLVVVLWAVRKYLK